jgi:hypothetical protein
MWWNWNLLFIKGVEMMSIGDNTEELYNPINTKFIAMILIVASLSIILGLILIDGSSSQIIGSIILVGYGVLAIILVVYREVVHRPISVIIVDDGLIMNFRFSGQKKIFWSDIEWLSVSQGNSTSTQGKWEKYGSIKLVNEYFYSLTNEIAHKIKITYYNNIGEFPKTKEEFINVRKNKFS